MALEDWLQKLKSTETYQAGVYPEAEYSIKRRLPIWKRSLPPVPHADHDRHIIVMEIVGNAPVFVAALTAQRPSIHAPARDADRMLFLFVEMRSRSLDVSAASGTYKLADGNDVDCQVALQWQVTDAEAFWKGSADPVESLRGKVIDTVRGFFAALTSERLLEDPVLVKRDLADRIADRGITIVKNGLEERIQQHARVPGINMNSVSATIVPSALLTEHLRRLREQIYGQGGLADRRKTDRLLDIDQTYAPYKLREVARFLDMRLLENFYHRPWQEAMNELASAFEAKKAEYRPKDELTLLEDALNRAQQRGLDEQVILDLKDKYADALFKTLEVNDTRSAISDQAFLMAVLGPPEPSARITSDPTAEEDQAAEEDGEA